MGSGLLGKKNTCHSFQVAHSVCSKGSKLLVRKLNSDKQLSLSLSVLIETEPNALIKSNQQAHRMPVCKRWRAAHIDLQRVPDQTQYLPTAAEGDSATFSPPRQKKAGWGKGQGTRSWAPGWGFSPVTLEVWQIIPKLYVYKRHWELNRKESWFHKGGSVWSDFVFDEHKFTGRKKGRQDYPSSLQPSFLAQSCWHHGFPCTELLTPQLCGWLGGAGGLQHPLAPLAESGDATLCHRTITHALALWRTRLVHSLQSLHPRLKHQFESLLLHFPSRSLLVFLHSQWRWPKRLGASTYLGDTDEALGSRLQPVSAPALWPFGEENSRQNLSLFFLPTSVSLCLPNKMNKSWEKQVLLFSTNGSISTEGSQQS